MTGGLKKTFEVFSQTENEAVVQVLIPALDSPTPAIAEASLRPAGTSQPGRSARNHPPTAYYRRGWKALILEGRGGMSQALRTRCSTPNPQTCRNGCDAILWFREYDVIPTLVNAAEDESNPQLPWPPRPCCRSASCCTKSWPRHAITNSARSAARTPPCDRAASKSRSFASASTNGRRLSNRFCCWRARQRHADADSADPLHSCFVAMIQMLTHSIKPGVMRLVLSHLDNPQAPTSLVSVLATAVTSGSSSICCGRSATPLRPAPK